jgi:hypothetical protein
MYDTEASDVAPPLPSPRFCCYCPFRLIAFAVAPPLPSDASVVAPPPFFQEAAPFVATNAVARSDGSAA